MAQETPPRIALLGIHLEANAFAPITTRKDFAEACYLKGGEITAEAAKENPAMPMEMVSFIHTMEAQMSWEAVPILLTGAEPGGPVEQAFFEELLADICKGLEQQMPVDGVYISNHGAMCATDSLDPDGDLFRMVRETVGSKVPIVVTLDLHANISAEMVAQTDVLISYLENPHVDQIPRGAEAAHTMMELLGGAEVFQAFLPLPLIPVQTSLLTAEGPYAELINHGQANKGPDIVNVSVLGGFSYGDTPRQGISVVVTSRNSLEPARALAREIAGMAWENRRRFTRLLTPIPEAVEMALARGSDSALPSLIFADVSDNPGGGGRGNTLHILKAMLSAAADDVLMGCFFDPPLAKEAHALGVGGKFDAAFNRSEESPLSGKMHVEAEVLALAEGAFSVTRGIYQGRAVDLGLCAALKIGGVRVVVISRRKQCAAPEFFTRLGQDPALARIVVVKSRGHFRAGFQGIFSPEQVIEVDAPGLTTQDIHSLPYQNIPQEKLFPFNPEAVWNPPAWVTGGEDT